MNTTSTHPAPSTAGPLAGIRVLDLTAVVLGPVATQILGDYGADVIKVESPEGDLVRANGVSRNRGMSSIFLAINRNKRSVAVDLKSAEGRALLLELASGVDVLVHNMRVAAIERLGLGYEAVRAVNPRIVYCVATGFAEGGPHAGRPAFDDVIQAACGLAAVNGSGRDMPDFVPSLIADKTTGLALANAVLAALLHRERSGEGQHVEVPMLETMTAFMLAEHLGGLTFEPATAPAGYARILAGGRKPSPTKDGFVAMLPYTVKHWEALFQAAGRDDLMGKYRLDDRHERNARVAELYADMVAITRTMTTAELLALCERIDVPATRIYSLAELPSHPHLVGVGLFRRVEHPSEGAMVEVRPPTLFSRSPASVRRQAPRLGEHTLEVFAEAGVAPERLERLAAAGVLVQSGRTG